MNRSRPGPEDILSTYETVASDWAEQRKVQASHPPMEASWLRRMLSAAPGNRVLDLGCGPGEPIARWLVSQGAHVTGVDGAAAMVALFRRAVPEAEAICADMRTLALGQRYDAVLAWDSFFHLPAADQRTMFPIFATHAVPGATLLFTSGPDAGEAWGQVAGVPVYHASLSPTAYRRALTQARFEVLDFAPNDPKCGGHSVWLARSIV